jgi:hypothetical protein
MKSYVRFGPMDLGPHSYHDFIDTILNPHDLSVFCTKYHCTDIIGSEKIGKSSKVIKIPVMYVKKLIIILIQFKFEYIMASNTAVLTI